MKATKNSQWTYMGVCNGQTDFALTLTIWPEKESYGCHTLILVEGEEYKLTTFSHGL